MQDLDAASLDDVRNFFRSYYAPSNASLALAGDLEPDEAVTLAERYFGDIPPGPLVSRLEHWVPRLEHQVVISMEDRVQLPRLYLVWPTPPFLTHDDAVLDLLASTLAEGRSSRLYRSLVHRRQIAQEVRARQILERSPACLSSS
jgi:zinc protease